MRPERQPRDNDRGQASMRGEISGERRSARPRVVFGFTGSIQLAAIGNYGCAGLADAGQECQAALCNGR